MSQTKGLLLVKPNKRPAHSSAIRCLCSSLPLVTDETTACSPTFRSASPGKAPLANKRLFQKAVTYFTQDFTHLQARICAEYEGCSAVTDFGKAAVPCPSVTMQLASATCMYMVTSPVYFSCQIR